jgi:hypothetical protein
MNDNTFEIWGHQIPTTLLSLEDIVYLNKYRESTPPSLEVLWAEMDRIWDQLGLDNRMPLNSQSIANYYRHPVWILNGFYSASDTVSIKHRELIANFALSVSAKKIADHGGGFGQLAICISKSCPSSIIEIIEPFPSEVGRYRTSQYQNIKICPEIGESYDILISQDVLEHVKDPIALTMDLIASVKVGGYLVFANCFYDVIKCHLPSTFHLRRTFPSIMKMAGLKYSGTLLGANHVQIFMKVGSINHVAVHVLKVVSKLIGPVLNRMK